MNKKKTVALLLALLMMFSLLTACGKSGEDSKKEDYLELDRGAYEVYDEDEELVGYLVVARKTLTAYDEEEVTDEYDYEFDDETGIYMIDDEEAFYVVEKKGDLVLTTCEDEDVYTLVEIDEEDLPESEDNNKPAADDATDAATSDGAAPDDAATEDTATPAEEPAETVELDSFGTYAAYENGTIVGYLDFWNDCVDVYEADGSYEEYPYSVTNDGVYIVMDGYGNELTRFTVQLVNGQMHMIDPDDPRHDYILEEFNYTDLPGMGDAPATDLTITTEIAAWGDVVVYANMPEEWYDVMNYEYDSDCSELDVQAVDADGNETDVMVVMGSTADVGASTTQEVGELLHAEYADDIADTSAVEKYVTMAGYEWYVLEYSEVVDDTFGVHVNVYGAVIEDQAIICLAVHYGTGNSALAAAEQISNWFSSFIVIA